MGIYQKTELLSKQAGSLNVRMSLYHDSVYSSDPKLGISPDIALEDISVGRRHANLKTLHGRITVEDLNSLTRTQLNGAVLTPHKEYALEHGDHICFGNVEVHFFEVR